MLLEEVKALLTKYEEDLLSPEGRMNIELNSEWFKGIANSAGVYAIFDSKRPIYIGETGSLRKRTKDLRDTRNHTLRRLIGEKQFSHLEGYEKASSRRKYAPHIEDLVVKALCKMEVKFLPVNFGRKEIEEHLTAKFDLYNKRTKRS